MLSMCDLWMELCPTLPRLRQLLPRLCMEWLSSISPPTIAGGKLYTYISASHGCRFSAYGMDGYFSSNLGAVKKTFGHGPEMTQKNSAKAARSMGFGQVANGKHASCDCCKLLRSACSSKNHCQSPHRSPSQIHNFPKCKRWPGPEFPRAHQGRPAI